MFKKNKKLKAEKLQVSLQSNILCATWLPLSTTAQRVLLLARGLNGTEPIAWGAQGGAAVSLVYGYAWRHKWLWSTLERQPCRVDLESLARSCVGVGAFVEWKVLFGDKHSTANTSHCFSSAAFVFLWNGLTKEGPLRTVVVDISNWLFCGWMFKDKLWICSVVSTCASWGDSVAPGE